MEEFTVNLFLYVELNYSRVRDTTATNKLTWLGKALLSNLRMHRNKVLKAL